MRNLFLLRDIEYFLVQCCTDILREYPALPALDKYNTGKWLPAFYCYGYLKEAKYWDFRPSHNVIHFQ